MPIKIKLLNILVSEIYRNHLTLNQRGGSLDIGNETESEKIQLSQRSGSNKNIANVVTSELATNNKQDLVINDKFQTVKNDDVEFVGKDKTVRVGENSYELNGFVDKDQIDAHEEWKDAYRDIANLNAKFKIKRGGISLPDGSATDVKGERADNPVIGSKVFTVENKFNGYTKTPIRSNDKDEVTDYSPVPDRGKTKPAKEREIKEEDVTKGAGSQGSSAPGVLEFGAKKSAATEGGDWEPDEEADKIGDAILELQDTLNPIEQRMGNGGDNIKFTKRNKFEQVGATFNDYPSIRIDVKGRSQPFEIVVGKTGAFKNHDYLPHVEEVDNSSNFPCGNDDKVVGNRYSRNVGSGGINLKTTGTVEFGGATLKAGFKKININASHGISIGSEAGLELMSLKTITLRTNRQVYVESSLGVKNNLIVGGGLYVEGETYLHHVTAPLEVQQTQDTELLGKFATNEDRKLVIGEVSFGGVWFDVYAMATPDLIITPPHSHHFNNIPLRLMSSNEGVREIAGLEKINTHNNISQALPQVHERKSGLVIL